MSFISLTFLIFVIALVIVYFAVPKRLQWIVLLLASAVFYASAGVFGCFFIVFTAVTIYAGARIIQKAEEKRKAFLDEHKSELGREEKSVLKKETQNKKRFWLILVLVLNFGTLAMFKYFDVGALIPEKMSWAVPLGISFYTFQATGYLIDVYWGHVKAEKNFLRMLLFVSYFPQIIQGPISVYEELSAELFKEHRFTYENFSRGGRRVLWGVFKKLMIAEFLAPFVGEIFANYSNYAGAVAFCGAVAYSVQIYADFSGYMDIACGISQIMGIRLTENFLRPYFSKSVAEYWRRWHISLGNWFKKYVYYPAAVASAKAFGKQAVKRFGKGFGRHLPAVAALIVTWMATGVWHGNTAGYIAWGLLNGVFIIAALWTEPLFASWKQKLHIRDRAFYWRAFATIRTFLIVTFIKVLPEVGTLRDGLGLWKHIFSEHTIPHSLSALYAAVSGENVYHLKIAIVLTVVLFISSLLQRKRPLYEIVEKIPMAFRVLLIAGIILAIIGFGLPEGETVGGFIYARF